MTTDAGIARNTVAHCKTTRPTQSRFNSTKTAMDLYKNIRTGGVIINGTSTWRTDQLAYGGVKDSGSGKEGPRYAIQDMTEERLVLFNL